MSEIPHDTDDGFHEIQLSGKQLVFLFMATTVVSVVIFLCGVLVGRGVRVDAQAESPDAFAAAAPARAEETPGTANPTTAEPPAPPADSAAQLSYPNVLDEKKARREEPPPPAPKAEAPRPTTESKPASTPEPRVEPRNEPKPERAASEAPAGASQSGRWVVQIVALRDRGAANAIVQRLTGKGYPAFLVNPAPGSPAPVYKVQVGRYDDRNEAERIARRLEKEEKFNPWISR